MAKDRGALRRELSQYANCSAEAISNGSQAMVKFFIDDAKHDIAMLAEALEALITEVDGVVPEYESTPGDLQYAVEQARAALLLAKGERG